eukprot:4942660-Amphidinium_carterae.1
MGVDVSFTTRDLGVEVQWGPWRNPAQQSRIKSFGSAMRRRVVPSSHLWIGGIRSCATSMNKVCTEARSALGRSAQLRKAAELELTLN